MNDEQVVDAVVGMLMFGYWLGEARAVGLLHSWSEEKHFPVPVMAARVLRVAQYGVTDDDSLDAWIAGELQTLVNRC